jgi:hypothetical protein
VAYCIEHAKGAIALFMVSFQNTIEPQNTACDELPSACSGPEPVEGSRVEQGIINIEVGSATVPTWTQRARRPALLLYFFDV